MEGLAGGIVGAVEVIAAIRPQREIVIPQGTDHNHLEMALHLIDNLLIDVGGDEGDGNALGSETTDTADTTEVTIGVTRKIVVDDNIDTFNINSTTTKEIGGNQDTSVEFFEGIVLGNAFFLCHAGVDGDEWEITLGQEPVQLIGTSNIGNENDNLVEFKNIQKVVALAILLRFEKFDKVEVQT